MWFGLLPVRSPLLGESLLICFPELLRWFTSLSIAPVSYIFRHSGDTYNVPDYSIRKSGGKRICAPVPGLSQLITSFFAWQLPGIRHRPVFAWPYHLFRSFTKNRDFRVCTFSNQAVHNPSLKSFFYFQHTAEDIPVCFRPSFVISKNNFCYVL